MPLRRLPERGRIAMETAAKPDHLKTSRLPHPKISARPDRLLSILWAGILSAWAAGPAQAITNTLQLVSPASAAQGTQSLQVTFTLSAAPPAPASTVGVRSVTLGTIPGTAISRPTTNTVTATFDIPGGETPGAKDVTITYQGSYLGYKAGGFTVTAAPVLTADFSVSPASGVMPFTAGFTDTSVGTVTSRLWDFGDGSTSEETNPVHIYRSAGSFTVSLTVSGPLGSDAETRADCVTVDQPPANGAYAVVDTGQTLCYNATAAISPPAAGLPFFGQDAQIQGRQPAYHDNGDGTISDLNTGLMWVKARGSKVTWEAALAAAATCPTGGYSDWRVPTIKELYSLIDFSGANGQGFTSTDGYIPFIDTDYFEFAYGSGIGDERVIDCQDWSATPYVSTTMNGDATIFGVNFSDGRIKGYPQFAPSSGEAVENAFYVRYVRGNPDYAINNFVINGDGTITDKATRLMWSRDDSGSGMNWGDALAWVAAKNAAHHLGYSDWRLPNAKELQSIVDYARSPDTTNSAAIDPVFNCTGITNEAGAADFPFYWASTTLLDGTPSASGIYLCFGRAMGYMNSTWLDVHGAGAQRSDIKSGNAADYPTGHGPQGDAVRILNYVRLVRDVPASNAWRFAFVGDTHVPLSTISAEIASSVVKDDARLLIVGGDLTESGSSASASTLLSQLTSWRNALAPAASSGVPVYVIRGNHENDVPGGLATWNGFFSAAYAMPANGPSGETNLTYSFPCENALFIGLDHYTQLHRVNQAWLDQQLAANSRPHVFVFGHEPAFKAFHTDGLDDYPTERNAFWSSLQGAGARVYLCGHDHFFNAARIDDGNGDPADDLYQYIVGTGGSTNWPAQSYHYNGSNDPYTPIHVANVTSTYGYLLAEISGTGSSDRTVTLTWKQRTYDSGTASYIYVPAGTPLTYTAPDRNQDSVGDGIPDWWRRLHFGGDGTTASDSSSATADPDGDGKLNLSEYAADTSPLDAQSQFQIETVNLASGVSITFATSASRTYTLYTRSSLTSGTWEAVSGQSNIPGTGAAMTLSCPLPAANSAFYCIGVQTP